MERVAQDRQLGNRSDRREVPEALAAFRELENAYFKFVIAKPPDVDEVLRLVDRHSLPAERVVLMPEGVTPEGGSGARPMGHGGVRRARFRFSTRLHILLWGDQRGR